MVKKIKTKIHAFMRIFRVEYVCPHCHAMIVYHTTGIPICGVVQVCAHCSKKFWFEKEVEYINS